MDRQAIFNRAVLGLKAQGTPSLAEGFCVYRGPNNTKCALGFSIPDDKYTPELEDQYIELGRPIAFIFGAQESDDIDFLLDLQAIHDNAGVTHPNGLGFLSQVLSQSKVFAKKYRLEMPNV